MASNPLEDRSLVGEIKFPAALLTKPCKGPSLKIIIIDGESLNALDSSAIYALEEIHVDITSKGITLAFTGLKGPVRDAMVKSKLMKKIRYDHCFMSIQEAVDCYYNKCFDLPKNYGFQEYIKQANR